LVVSFFFIGKHHPLFGLPDRIVVILLQIPIAFNLLAIDELEGRTRDFLRLVDVLQVLRVDFFGEQLLLLVVHFMQLKQ